MEYLNKQTDMFLDLKSKTCCECGWINQDLNLSIREWTCKNGHVLDRDLNDAKTSVKKHKSVKPEAHLSLANG